MRVGELCMRAPRLALHWWDWTGGRSCLCGLPCSFSQSKCSGKWRRCIKTWPGQQRGMDDVYYLAYMVNGSLGFNVQTNHWSQSSLHLWRSLPSPLWLKEIIMITIFTFYCIWSPYCAWTGNSYETIYEQQSWEKINVWRKVVFIAGLLYRKQLEPEPK